MRCLSLFAMAVVAVLGCANAEARPMRFKPIMVGNQKVLLAEGDITINSGRAFLDALRRNGQGRTVLLHSPGGNLAGGLLLGIAFRETGTTVGVAPGGACYSACAYALFGGVNRRVPSGAQFGVHEFADFNWKPGQKVSARAKQENAEINRMLRQYAQVMGISPSVITMAERTRHDDIRVLSRKELKQMRVVNGG